MPKAIAILIALKKIKLLKLTCAMISACPRRLYSFCLAELINFLNIGTID